MHQTSQTTPGLVWHATVDSDGDYTWTAKWNGTAHTSADSLAQALPSALRTDAQQLESWLAFGLGLDAFQPVLDPTAWQAVFDRGPIDPDTGAADGVPVPPEHRIYPHQGKDGLEGLIVHTKTGHVLRAITAGLPPITPLALLVALTGQPAPDRSPICA